MVKIDSGLGPKIDGSQGIKKNSEKVPEDFQQVGDGFESMFTKMMLEEMRKAAEVPEEDRVIPKGNAEKIYESLLDSEYAQLLSRQGGLGVSKIVVDQLMRDRKGPK